MSFSTKLRKWVRDNFPSTRVEGHYDFLDDTILDIMDDVLEQYDAPDEVLDEFIRRLNVAVEGDLETHLGFTPPVYTEHILDLFTKNYREVSDSLEYHGIYALVNGTLTETISTGVYLVLESDVQNRVTDFVESLAMCYDSLVDGYL